MDLDTLIAQWSGKAAAGLRSARRPPRGAATVQAQALQRKPAAVKKDGTYAHACSQCLARRCPVVQAPQASADAAEGGCRQVRVPQAAPEGDFLCQRCRDERDVERARKRRDAIDAAAIDAFAAQPERVHKASDLDRGISPWNGEAGGRKRSACLLVAVAGSRSPSAEQRVGARRSTGRTAGATGAAEPFLSAIEARRLRSPRLRLPDVPGEHVRCSTSPERAARQKVASGSLASDLFLSI